MMSRDRTPRSLALVEDPRFLAAAGQLIGATVLPFYIAFDWHLRHTSIRGRDRRQWTVSYVRDPATADERAAFADVVIDGNLAFLLDDLEDYDHAAYPPFDDHWLAPDPAHPERVALSDRMRALGMFKVVEDA